MYRLLLFLLSIFCLALVAEIVVVTAWRDYQRHGDVVLHRALGSAVSDMRQVVGLGKVPGDLAVEPAVHGEPATLANHLTALKAELLYLINSQRVRAQAPPLVPGVNPAAQNHAENMMAYGYRSHWDIYGLTPQMRYTLAGGTNRVMQNIAGPVAHSASTEKGFEAWRELVEQIHQGFMADPEGRANVLDPLHRKLNVGLPCDYADCWVVQQFESDQVEFNVLPNVSAGKFEAEGEFREGFELGGVLIWHHPYPRRLSLGQLDATYRYGYGQSPATILRPPLSPDRFYPDRLTGYEWDGGIDPYTLQPSLARSSAAPLMVKVAHSAAVPWTTASRWDQSGAAFSVHADLSLILQGSGPGVYTAQIWGRRGDEQVPLTNYAIFVP